MSDLISRQAAIDALDKVAEMFPYRIPGKAKTYRQYNEAWSDAIDAAENALESLPSAQPDVPDTNVGNTDTISRQAAIDALNKRWRTCIIGESLIRDAKDTLKELPSATDTNVGGNLINRQAVIESIQECADAAHRNHEWDMEQGYRNAIECVEEAPSAQPGWIPTSVKPPEPFKLVLIQDYCGCYELNTYIPPRINPKQYPNGYWGEVGTVDFDYFDVEAWMPLPTPYREGGQDGKN